MAEVCEVPDKEIDEVISLDKTCHPPSRERNTTFRESNPPSRERNPTSRQSNPTSRQSNPLSSRESTFSQQQKRCQAVYSQHLRLKPLNIQSIIEAQKRISLNPTYIKKCNRNSQLHERIHEKVRLTKACHRPVSVPLVKIIGRIPRFVDMSVLQGLRHEVKRAIKIVTNVKFYLTTSLQNYERIITKLWNKGDMMFIEGTWS